MTMRHSREDGSPACLHCGAPVRWAETAAGKRVPLDESSDPNGNWIFMPNGRVVQLDGWSLERHRDNVAAGKTTQLLFMHHNASCTAKKSRQPIPQHVLDRLEARKNTTHIRRATR